MTNKVQLDRNLLLSEKLAEFLSNNSEFLGKYQDCSYVVFSAEDEGLNKVNYELASELVGEGKKVVKATHDSKAKPPWKFEPLYL